MFVPKFLNFAIKFDRQPDVPDVVSQLGNLELEKKFKNITLESILKN